MKTPLSLDRPFKGDSTFALIDTIVADKDEFEGISTEAKVKIPQARRSIEIDQDVVNAMRARYGNMPLGRALRILLGLKPKIAQNAWQEEEDVLIFKYYPLHGGPPLAKVFGRSVDCIRERAAKLGVKRHWLYKRDRRCYNAVRREREAMRRQQRCTHELKREAAK